MIRLKGGRWLWPEKGRCWLFLLRDEGWEVYVAAQEADDYGPFVRWNGVFPSRGHAMRAVGVEP